MPKRQKDKVQTNSQHLTFQEVQFSTGTLQLILYNPLCILPFKENIFVVAFQPPYKERNEVLFCTFCLYTDKESCDTISSVITQKYIKHSTHCEEIYTSPSLFLLGICGSMVIYFKWNRSISVLVFFSCLEVGSLVQM